MLPLWELAHGLKTARLRGSAEEGKLPSPSSGAPNWNCAETADRSPLPLTPRCARDFPQGRKILKRAALERRGGDCHLALRS